MKRRMLLLLLLVFVLSPAWAGGEDDPGIGTSQESTTATLEDPVVPEPWWSLGWLVNLVRSAFGPLAL